MTKELLELIALEIQEERRRRNNQLLEYTQGNTEIYNGEDLFRLVGELNAAYNHCVASMAADGNIYCLLKHLATAVVLAGEVDGNAETIYQIVATLTKNKIQPCKACVDEQETQDGLREND